MTDVLRLLVRSVLSVLVPYAAFSSSNEAFGGSDTGGFLARVYIDQSTPYDPGNVVAILCNGTKGDARIGQIRMNGVVVKDWQSPTDPILWHRLTDEVLQAGQKGLLIVKLAAFRRGPLSLEMEVGGEAVKSFAEDTVEPVRISAVRYHSSGRRVNVFLTNGGSRTEEIIGWEIRGQGIQGRAEEPFKIKPGETGVVRIRVPTPLSAGQAIQVFIHLKDRMIGTRHRAFPGFRVSVESPDVDMASRIHADPDVLEMYQFHQEKQYKPATAAPSLMQRYGERQSLYHPSHGGYVSNQTGDLACIGTCVTHATDSYHTAAYLARVAQDEVERTPCWQSYIFACRTAPLQGIALFGQIGDFIRFENHLQTAVSTPSPNRDLPPWSVYQLARYAVISAAPSKALSIIPVTKDRMFPERAPLATEARQMVYSAISAGVGGIAYRFHIPWSGGSGWGEEGRDKMIDEVTTVNDEIHQIREYLAFGYPVGTAKSNDPMIQAVCLDAAPEGLIVILLNHDIARSAPEMPASVEVNEHKGVMVELDMPSRFKPKAILEITGTEQHPVATWKVERRKLRLNLASVLATKVLVVEGTPVERR